MLFSHPCKMSIQTIFSSYFRCFWPMIYLLMLSKGLIDYRFDVGAGPHDAPFLFSVADFSKAIVLHSIPDQRNIDAVVKFEIQFFILRFIWPDAHGIDVWSKKHVLFRKFTCHSWRLKLSFFVSLVNFALDDLLLLFLLLFIFTHGTYKLSIIKSLCGANAQHSSHLWLSIGLQIIASALHGR